MPPSRVARSDVPPFGLPGSGNAAEDADGEANGRALKAALVDTVFEQGYSPLLLGAVCLVLCAALLQGALPYEWLAPWLAAALATIVLRLPLVALASFRRGERSALRLRLHIVLTTASGAAWGALALLWSPGLELVDQLVMLIFPLTMSLGAIAAYGPCPPLYFGFVVPMQLPFVLVFFAAPGYDKLASIMVIAFFSQTLLVRRHYRQVHELLRLRTGNESLVRDLSARNAALADARDEARSASAAKSEFLARMSHEIRTPMNGVLGVSELLSATALDAVQTRLLDTLRDSGRSLLGLLERLLDIASVEGGRIALETRDYAPRELFEEVLGEELPRARARSLSLRWSVDSSVPSRIHGDPSRLGQIVHHLIDNAVRFTEEGGVRVHLTVARDGPDAPRLLLSVADSGIGIPAEDLDVVFEPFRQGDETGARRKGGTGLGLALVREFAAMMGGSVRVTSSPGAGSTFVVELPLQRAVRPVTNTRDEGRSPIEGEEAAVVRAPLAVLVAEDDPVNQMVIEAMLEGMGCAVTLVEDGARALAALEERPFDIVFMDCRMPGVDGFEAARRARAGGFALPIVAVTAEALPGDRERCLAAGMSDYMTKPLSSATLSTMLDRWGRRSAFARRRLKRPGGLRPPPTPCAAPRRAGR